MGKDCVVNDLKMCNAGRVCALHRKSSYMHPEKTLFEKMLEFHKNIYEKILDLKFTEGALVLCADLRAKNLHFL